MLHLLHKGAVRPENIGIVRRVLDCPAEQRVRLTVSSGSWVSAGMGTGAEGEEVRCVVVMMVEGVQANQERCGEKGMVCIIIIYLASTNFRRGAPSRA